MKLASTSPPTVSDILLEVGLTLGLVLDRGLALGLSCILLGATLLRW